jgi:hypothetical protein
LRHSLHAVNLVVAEALRFELGPLRLLYDIGEARIDESDIFMANRWRLVLRRLF